MERRFAWNTLISKDDLISDVDKNWWRKQENKDIYTVAWNDSRVLQPVIPDDQSKTKFFRLAKTENGGGGGGGGEETTEHKLGKRIVREHLDKIIFYPCTTCSKGGFSYKKHTCKEENQIKWKPKGYKYLDVGISDGKDVVAAVEIICSSEVSKHKEEVLKEMNIALHEVKSFALIEHCYGSQNAYEIIDKNMKMIGDRIEVRPYIHTLCKVCLDKKRKHEERMEKERIEKAKRQEEKVQAANEARRILKLMAEKERIEKERIAEVERIEKERIAEVERIEKEKNDKLLQLQLKLKKETDLAKRKEYEERIEKEKKERKERIEKEKKERNIRKRKEKVRSDIIYKLTSRSDRIKEKINQFRTNLKRKTRETKHRIKVNLKRLHRMPSTTFEQYDFREYKKNPFYDDWSDYVKPTSMSIHCLYIHQLKKYDRDYCEQCGKYVKDIIEMNEWSTRRSKYESPFDEWRNKNENYLNQQMNTMKTH